MKAHSTLPEIEIFDLSHLYGMRRLMDQGLIGEHPHVQFVMGTQNALPVDEFLLGLVLSVFEPWRRMRPGPPLASTAIRTKGIEWVLKR